MFDKCLGTTIAMEAKLSFQTVTQKKTVLLGIVSIAMFFRNNSIPLNHSVDARYFSTTTDFG